MNRGDGKTMIKEKLLNDILNKMIDNKSIFSAVLCVENGDRSFSWTAAAGKMQKDSRFFIASVTKLYVTAVVMQLIEEKRISLSDKITEYLPPHFCEGLHIFNGIDYSKEITVAHLISNTSGLPDYFFHKQPGGKTVSVELMEGKDEAWPVDRTIDLIKKLKPNFRPGKKGKASYSDSNYQLLGKIMETVTGKSIDTVFQDYLFSKMNLNDTYAYKDINDKTPVPFYYKNKELWLPQYIESVTVEGGIVSTADELMIFLKEFFRGRFFPEKKIMDLKQWNLILPPPGLFYFGIGLEKLPTPRIFSPFKPIREVLGFWGQTGSFAFYNPETELYFSGTTNQINGKGHMAAGSAIMKILKSV
jgi:D-alanyl-D-alanine carboxypeptidase